MCERHVLLRGSKRKICGRKNGSQPRIARRFENGARSALEALVRLPVVEQVSDPVGAVLEDRGGSEDQDAELWIHEGDDVQSGNEAGELADQADVFERFHGSRAALSSSPQLADHLDERHQADEQADRQ